VSISDAILARRPMLENDVRTCRSRLGWSQDELARRSGLSRAGISAIETGRLVPSTAAALALAGALGCTVESLFRLPGTAPAESRGAWAWPRPSSTCRFWRAEVAGRQFLYPVEASPLGLLPHDGTFRNEALHEHPRDDPARTLVMACCDPAVGLLAAELARQAELRLVVLPRSSHAALELLARGLVHAAGVHLARSDQSEGNAVAVCQLLGAVPARYDAYHLLRIADWDEGIAIRPGSGLDTIRAVVGAKLRWVVREPGSGAQQCLDEVIGRPDSRRPPHRWPRAFDHRGVADAIRGEGADAGICLRLTSAEAGLRFLSVRPEAYEICLPEPLARDPRALALLRVVRSTGYRRLLADLPGYDTARTGDLNPIRLPQP
jgi:molybdate-binding protein/transcriptional regulator with XRE-family HTH domain